MTRPEPVITIDHHGTDCPTCDYEHQFGAHQSFGGWSSCLWCDENGDNTYIDLTDGTVTYSTGPNMTGDILKTAAVQT